MTTTKFFARHYRLPPLPTAIDPYTKADWSPNNPETGVTGYFDGAHGSNVSQNVRKGDYGLSAEEKVSHLFSLPVVVCFSPICLSFSGSYL